MTYTKDMAYQSDIHQLSKSRWCTCTSDNPTPCTTMYFDELTMQRQRHLFRCMWIKTLFIYNCTIMSKHLTSLFTSLLEKILLKPIDGVVEWVWVLQVQVMPSSRRHTECNTGSHCTCSACKLLRCVCVCVFEHERWISYHALLLVAVKSVWLMPMQKGLLHTNGIGVRLQQ